MDANNTDPHYSTEPVKKDTKFPLPRFLFGGLLLYFAGLLLFIFLLNFGDTIPGLKTHFAFDSQEILMIALSVILTWLVVLVGFYVWSIYHYNINLGYPQRYWDILWQKIREARIAKKAGLPPVEPEPAIPNVNPYKGETLGLPHGTIRATIALTLLVGSMTMLIIVIAVIKDDPGALLGLNLGEGGGAADSPNPPVEANIFFNKIFDFFVVAFQMMIAFYFGANAVKYFQARQGIDSGDADSAGTTLPGSEKELGDDEEGFTEDDFLVDDEMPSDLPGGEVPTGVLVDDEVMKAESEKRKIAPAVIRAIAVFASGGRGFLQEAGVAPENARVSLRWDGKAFWDALEAEGKDAQALSAGNTDILWKDCQDDFKRGTADGYDRLNKAMQLCKDNQVDSAMAKLCGRWGMFEMLGNQFADAGFTNFQGMENKFTYGEKHQLDAFFAWCSHNDLFKLLQKGDLAGFAKAWWGPCSTSLKYGMRLEKAMKDAIKAGWAGPGDATGNVPESPTPPGGETPTPPGGGIAGDSGAAISFDEG